MRNFHIVVLLFVLHIFCPSLLASRELPQDEILSIVKNLTDNPIEKWIKQGQIQGIHSQYSALDNTIVDSTELIKIQGDKFYQEINIISDLLDEDLPSDIKKDLQDNSRRIFVWDGIRYSMYFASTNNALVTEDTRKIPVKVDGILTAGVIPWGRSIFTYDNISNSKLSAIENYKDQIVLSIKNSLDIEMFLDPKQDYAVLEYRLYLEQGGRITIECSDHKLIGNTYIPHRIIKNQYASDSLISTDEWVITEINTDKQAQAEFVPPYKNKAFIEYILSSGNRKVSYNYSDKIDMELLLQKKLQQIETADSGNCASLAIEWVLSKYDKQMDMLSVNDMANGQNETSLYDMRKYISGCDLYCSAVNTTLGVIEETENCNIILYLPESKHYVVLEQLGPKEAWIIDFSSEQFVSRISRSELDLLWSDKTALIISSDLSKLSQFSEITDNQAKMTTGASLEGIPAYSCSELILEYAQILCPEPIMGFCSGRQWVFPENRYGCIEDESATGTCTGKPMISKVYAPCRTDIDGTCYIIGDWIGRSIRACR